jgi:hypothetical protein
MEERSALGSPMSKGTMENHHLADHKMVIKEANVLLEE